MKTKTCPGCQETKELSEFPPSKRSPSGIQARCRDCKNAYQREWCSRNRERVRASFRKHYVKNHAAILESQRLRRIRDKDKIRERNKKYRQRIRYEVLSHYGGDPPQCACCDEPTIEFLSIDHIDGGGYQHIKTLQAQGTSLYLWLRKEKFPKGFQVLCHNCNQAKGFYGICPHKTHKEQINE